MRIDNRPLSVRDKVKKGKASTEKPKESFFETLQKLDDETNLVVDPEEVSEGDLRNLAGMIEEFGDNLSRNPTPENFARYKKHIRVFVSITSQNLEVVNIRVRGKMHFLVDEIDSKLQKIAQMVLSGEKDRMNYLKLVSHIKGLIIDLIS